MRLVKHWVRVRGQLTIPAGPRALSAVGWSNESQSAAEAMAKERLEVHRSRLLAGSNAPSSSYPYADGRPLQEEIVQTVTGADGAVAALLTRNAYGALVLNCDRVLFIDLDFANFVPQTSFWSRWFGKRGSHEDSTLAHAQRVAARTPQWGFRVYRTLAGLRLVLTSAAADARDPFWIDVLQTFGSDPMYVKLCQSQQSFRARLTPKPWRCDFPRPTLRYPYASDGERAQVEAWVHRYERLSERFATCRLLTTFGPRDTLGSVDRIVALHDRYALNGDLPLA